MSNTESQTVTILNHLLTYPEGITSLEAINYYQILRASGRIKELREKGFDIKTKMIVTAGNKRIALYHL